MFVLIDPYFRPNVIIGSLVIYSLLFFLCIYAYNSRSSKNINLTLHLTLTTSIFGVLNSALQIGAPYTSSGSSADKTLIVGLFFGLTLVPLTWTVGISLFSVLIKEKRPLPVLLGYMLTLVQFVLIVVCIVYIGEFIDGYDYFSYTENLRIYASLIISIMCINWGFFLLFFWLVIQYRRSIPKSILITVIIFGVLNTARLITETVLLFTASDVGVEAMLYIMFFFTDFISCMSLYMTTLFWKNVKETRNDQQLIE